MNTIVIPILNPTEKFNDLITELYSKTTWQIVVVNDGSTKAYNKYFSNFPVSSRTHLIHHKNNHGKGAALKTAFNYILENNIASDSIITVDGDGQHAVPDIVSIGLRSQDNSKIIMGTRKLSKNIPLKNFLGNKIIRNILKLFFRIDLPDAQTGLRSFPRKLLPKLISLKGNRFDYEISMLFFFNSMRIDIIQHPIKTIYFNSPSSHYKPLFDSYLIANILWARFYIVIRSCVKQFTFFLPIYNKFLSFKNRKFTTKQIFTNTNWSGDLSLSGPGSNLVQTEKLRFEINKILSLYNINSILDIPCGDFFWMNEVDLENIKYIGADIVDEIITSNQHKYSNKNRTFTQADIRHDILPKVDLILCRDLFVHFSFQDIKASLLNIKQSGAIYLLTTTFTNCSKNSDIKTGGWRKINLEKSPFNFPPPIYLVNEGCSEGRSFKDKSIHLWKIDELP